MKGIVFAGNRQVELRDFPDPEPGDDDVVLEIKASGMWPWQRRWGSAARAWR
jgi:D-arabinose 1-dehydrogenase-like Zn-dependent alcohol dehydrogenase